MVTNDSYTCDEHNIAYKFVESLCGTPETNVTFCVDYVNKKKVYTKTCTQMFTAAFFTIAETWKQQKWNIIIQCQKGMNYQAMKKHGGNLNVYYKVKESNLKRLYTV